MQNLLLFDFDGVIVDSLDIYERRVKLCMEKMGKPVVRSRADFLALFEDNFYEAVAKKGIDVLEFMNESKALPIQDDYDQMLPFAPMLPVLDELKKSNVLVIISSNISRVIHDVLARNNFNGCFRDVLGAESGYSKRDKILHAMTVFQMDKDRTFYIGDTAGDIREARTAGVRTVAVTWGWHTRAMLEKVNPDYLLDVPNALLDLK